MAESSQDLAALRHTPPARNNASAITTTEDTLWRTLLSPLLVMAVAGLMLVPMLALLFFPQLPDQLQSEPAAAARWTMDMASAYGAAGPMLNSLGLFNVLNSPLFRILLAVMTLLAAAHLADTIRDALTYRLCIFHLCDQPNEDEQPPKSWRQMAPFGFRTVLVGERASLTKRVTEMIPSGFTERLECATEADTVSGHPNGHTEHELLEWRGVADRNSRSYFLRILLPLGFLMILLLVWIYVYYGWQLTTGAIAPGETYAAPNFDLVVAYDLDEQATDAQVDRDPVQSIISIQFGSRAYTTTVAANTRATIGANQLSLAADTPGVIVQTADGRPLLVAPGDTSLSDTVGVVLPSPGSEAALLIPSASMGVRLVRLTDDPTAIIAELYRGAGILPVERIDVGESTSTMVDAEDESIVLKFVQAPGIDLTIRHNPGNGLIWAALLSVVVGYYGFWRKPQIMFTQLQPWNANSELLTVCASQQNLLESMIERIETDGTEAESE